jgi:Flp pilus assembly protein TadG
MMTSTHVVTGRSRSRGQVLVLFVLCLLALLGISALAIDYAGWLLTDRSLQNVADHAALAGASEFRQRESQGNCAGGNPKCIDARVQMWTSLNEELNLVPDPDPLVVSAAITALATSDSPANGTTSVTVNATTFAFRDRIWVTTPPPTYAAYTSAGGRFASNFGVTFVRVDRQVRSFIGGALGIQPQPRAGWATAGALPIGFALETFCRNNIAPQSGVCANSSGLTIDGQGGIRLLRGDIGSNESLKVTANGGQGVQTHSGDVFLVNGACGSSSWNCPNGPPSTGGISNGAPSYIGKNAFYMAPLPIPRFASPLDVAGISAYDCSGASATNLCIPYKDQGSATPTQPGTWTCFTTGSVNRCGAPTVTSGTVACIGQGGGLPPLHYYPVGPSLNSVNADAAHPQSNANKFKNIDDDFLVPDPDTTNPPGNPATDYLYTNDINVTGGGGPQMTQFIVNLGASGPRLPGISTVRYTAFKTFGGAPDNTGNPVTLQVRLLPGSGTTAIAVDPTVRTLTDVPERFEFTVGAGVIPANQFNTLRLEFTFTSQGGTTSPEERGGAIAWAEIQHPDPQPALTPMIPPGYYRSIDIPANSCAILDPTAEYSSLEPYQMPGIYRFGGSGNDRKVQLQSGSYLIGDGVTLVFDSDWPDSGSQRGLTIESNAALVLNTMRVPGTPPCTPTETETALVNESAPLMDLPYSGVCAAWGIDPDVTVGIRPGQNAWGYCDPANLVNPQCVNRDEYAPTAYRGVTFYFTPDPGWGTAHASMSISNRFEMQGGVGGLAFRGVLYAPYDDVTIQGGNGFNTVGQVLAWTAKFNGNGPFIELDFPYNPASAAPYLLEPTINH